MRHGGAVGDAGADIIASDLRKMMVDDLLARKSIRQQIKHQGNPDAVTSDARAASAARGIDPDMGLKLFRIHRMRLLQKMGNDKGIDHMARLP